MASPEFKKWFPVVMVPTVAVASIAAVAIGILNVKNGVGTPHDEVFVWPTPSASASPFPTLSATPSPTLIESPSDDATTSFPEETPTTPVATPTKTPTSTPTHSPSPSPHETTVSPTNMPLDVVVTDSRYYSTSRNSGLAQIDSITRNPSDGTKDTHTSEFNVQCGAYVVKIGVVSFTDGEQDVLKKPIQQRD